MIPDYDEPDLRHEQQLEDQRVAALLAEQAQRRDADPSSVALDAGLEGPTRERFLLAAALLEALRD